MDEFKISSVSVNGKYIILVNAFEGNFPISSGIQVGSHHITGFGVIYINPAYAIRLFLQIMNVNIE
jgi:hypothetical protein